MLIVVFMAISKSVYVQNIIDCVGNNNIIIGSNFLVC